MAGVDTIDSGLEMFPVPAAAVMLLPRLFFFEPEVNVTDPLLVTTALSFFFPVPGDKRHGGARIKKRECGSNASFG